MRLQYLESKLEAVEKAAAKDALVKGDPKGKPPSAVATRSKPAARQLERSSPPAPIAVEPPVTGTEQPARTQTANIETEKEKSGELVPQETFIFRDQAPTLKKGSWELSTELNYLRGNGFLQSDRGVTAAGTVRYGLADGLEIYASLPYFYTVRVSNTPFGAVSAESHGIGSGVIGLSYSLLAEKPEHPGVAISVTGIYPGSVSPYFFPVTYAAGGNPVDPRRNVPASGHWGAAANAVAYKVVDPLVLYVGIGMQYFLPRTIFGHEVEPALRFLMNMGFNFALSEKTTLAFDFRSSYAPDFKVDGVTAVQSSQEQHVARVVVTQRIADQTWVEPSIGMGVTKDSPDLNLGVGVRKRF